MRVLVTGASGFIGERLLSRMAADAEVYALSRRRPEHLGEAHQWIHADMGHPIDRSDLPETIDTVVHLAVSYRHREFPESADDLFGVNTASTAQLLDYARAAGATHFVYGSSGSVYAPTGAADQREDSPPQPGEFFSATKLASELLVGQYAQWFSTYIPRLFFPYGPGQTDRLIPGLIGRVRSGAPVTLVGDDQGLVISPSYVDDVVEVLMAAIDDRWQGVMNVAGPEAMSLRDVATAIGGAVGREPVFDTVPGPPPSRFEPDLAMLDAAFGLGRFRSFAAGIAATVAHGS